MIISWINCNPDWPFINKTGHISLKLTRLIEKGFRCELALILYSFLGSGHDWQGCWEANPSDDRDL